MMRPRTGAQKVPPHAQFAPSSSPVATARALLLTSSHFSGASGGHGRSDGRLVSTPVRPPARERREQHGERPNAGDG
jgi:hypothetical protein